VEQAVVANNSDCEEADSFLDGHCHLNTPEEIVLAQQTLDKYEQLFSGYDTAQMVLMAQSDGYSPQEIQEICGLTPVEYASTLRFIRRKLDKFADEEL
jgi:DNA-directed RNA polymerase specialized sigma24 family protein